jgi:hypothetical protein
MEGSSHGLRKPSPSQVLNLGHPECEATIMFGQDGRILLTWHDELLTVTETRSSKEPKSDKFKLCGQFFLQEFVNIVLNLVLLPTA